MIKAPLQEGASHRVCWQHKFSQSKDVVISHQKCQNIVEETSILNVNPIYTRMDTNVKFLHIFVEQTIST